MADNLVPGEKVSWNQGAGDIYIVEPLNGYIIRVRNERTGESWFPRRQDLTRIEPDVPQPKFSVGQSVDLISHDGTHPGVVTEVERRTEFTYNIKWPSPGTDSLHVVERNLKAVPVCPTCGGKVADG